MEGVTNIPSIAERVHQRVCLHHLVIKEKKEVGEGQKAQWTRKSNLPEVTKSWQD